MTSPIPLPPAEFSAGGCGLPGHNISVRQPKRDPRMTAGWRFMSAECYDCRKAKGRVAANARHTRRRNEANSRYGPGCRCCGEQALVFLAVDHVEGGGCKQRRDNGWAGSGGFYRWLESEGWPGGYQILCHNCNHAKHALGECPHRSV